MKSLTARGWRDSPEGEPALWLGWAGGMYEDFHVEYLLLCVDIHHCHIQGPATNPGGLGEVGVDSGENMPGPFQPGPALLEEEWAPDTPSHALCPHQPQTARII